MGRKKRNKNDILEYFMERLKMPSMIPRSRKKLYGKKKKVYTQGSFSKH